MLPSFPNILSSQDLSCGTNHTHLAVFYVDISSHLQLVVLDNFLQVVGVYEIDTGFNYTVSTQLAVTLASEVVSLLEVSNK